MSRVQKLEHRIDQKLRQMLRSSSPNQAREPIELYRAILEEVTSRVDALPRGRLIFVYSRVSIRVLLPNPERRRSYELTFTEADSLTRDIKSHFEENKVEFPTRFKVDVELVDSFPPDMSERGFEVTYSNPPASVPGPDTIRLRLTILVGNAERNQYEFAKNRINIGRLAEVLDSDMRTVRRNDIAVKDDSTVENSTVSRAHAHIEYDPDANRFRLFDDGSARGTTVIRDGSVIPVPQGNSKGILLRPGDEIILAKVRIRFEDAGT
jgi:pSer/pThr/pTyr-binding forkhead associated (FHA) protein